MTPDTDNQRFRFCPECGVVYFTKQANCMGHPMGIDDDPEDHIMPLLVDLDAELAAYELAQETEP